MKRMIALAVLTSLILCGCCNISILPGETALQTQPATEPAVESIPTAQLPTETGTEPTQPAAEKVTVYLLTKSVLADSGTTEYHYDEAHNIDSYTAFTIENTIWYETFFEKKDANGMACEIRMQWAGGYSGDTRNLTYFEDGKLKEEQIAGSNYTGYQYAYDQKGNITEKREYYDGILQSAVYYEYDAERLKAVYCEDAEGKKLFECRVENGRILEKTELDSDSQYGYRYKYDENNNLIETIFTVDGEELPGEQFFYQAVEVDTERACYLRQQQNYLIPII